MKALELFHYEYGKDGLCPLTKLPPNCPKDYGYLADAEWCSEGMNNEDCARCWAREVPDPFIAASLPNYTPVDERKGYCDLGAFRLVIEDGNAVGVYCPGGLEFDAATITNGDSFVSAICKVAEKAKISVEEAVTALFRTVGIAPDAEDAG
jgi:hypothetical protein